MRSTGVQQVNDAPPAAGSRSRSPVLFSALAVFVIAAALAGYFAFGKRPKAGEVAQGGPLSASMLHDVLAAQHIDAGELEALLRPEPSVERFAKQAIGSASTPIAKAEAVQKAIRARASALAFVPWSLGEPRTTVVQTPAQTAAVLAKDKGRAQLYPLEVASLAVAALRSQAVPAMVAELISVDNERAPLDPSGYLGYFVVAVYPEEPGLGAPRLFDPYGGRELPATPKHNVLSDTRVIGAALALRALHETSYLADPRRALTSSSNAIEIAGTLPSVRTVRGMVVLASRQVEQGMQEFTAARQLRNDAPRLHNVASIELMTGDVEAAVRDLDGALAQAPDFAALHATLGSLALVRGDVEEGARQIDEAEKIAPDLSLVQWAAAELKFREGDRDACLTVARRALASHPSFDARVRMGVLLRQMVRFDELREVAKELLAMAPAYRQDEVRDLIVAALGPAALDKDARDPEAEEAADPTSPGIVDPTAAPPSLVEPGPSRRPEPNFKLRGDDQLQLHLNR